MQRSYAAAPVAGGVPDRHLRWLALGDSYSSGEGVVGAGGHCERASDAYAPKAHTILSGKEDDLAIERPVFLACTGATISDNPDSESIDLVEQMQRASGRYDLITLTIGGNDVGFSGILTRCVTVGCVDEGQLQRRVDAVAQDLSLIYGRLIEELLAPGGHIVVLGYPRLFEPSESWPHIVQITESCELVADYDADKLRRLAGRLNGVIADTADEYPGVVHYLDIAEDFEGHNLCAGIGTTDEWINGLTLGNYDRFWPRHLQSFHPNAAGHEAEAEMLADAVADLNWSGSTGNGEVMLRRDGMTVTDASETERFDLRRRPSQPIATTLVRALGEPIFDLTDQPSCRGTRWLAWGPAERPYLVVHTRDDELVGFWAYSKSRRVQFADEISIGAPASALQDAYRDDLTFKGAGQDGPRFELDTRPPPLKSGPAEGELSSRRGTGQKCSSWLKQP